MGSVADGALAAGGEVIGVIPRELVERELAHQGLTKLHVVESLHERKALMAELADGFVALPGGFGTLDELAEQLTWSQLGLHAKPVGLLDVEGYWGPLIVFAQHATAEGFVREADLGAIAVADDADALLDRLLRALDGAAAAAEVGAAAQRRDQCAPKTVATSSAARIAAIASAPSQSSVCSVACSGAVLSSTNFAGTARASPLGSTTLHLINAGA